LCVWKIRSSLFWVFIQCWLVFDYGHFSFSLHWHLKLALIVCPETSVNNYQPTLHKNREEWRPQRVFKFSHSKYYCGGSVCVLWIKLMEEFGTFTPFISVTFASVCIWRAHVLRHKNKLKCGTFKYRIFSNLIVSAHVNYGDIFYVTFYLTFTFTKYLTGR
jgi:hypothetical protein